MKKLGVFVAAMGAACGFASTAMDLELLIFISGIIFGVGLLALFSDG